MLLHKLLPVMKDDAVLLLIKISINLVYCVDDNVYTLTMLTVLFNVLLLYLSACLEVCFSINTKGGKPLAPDGDYELRSFLRQLSLPERSQLMCLGGWKFLFYFLFFSKFPWQTACRFGFMILIRC